MELVLCYATYSSVPLVGLDANLLLIRPVVLTNKLKLTLSLMLTLTFKLHFTLKLMPSLLLTLNTNDACCRLVSHVPSSS